MRARETGGGDTTGDGELRDLIERLLTLSKAKGLSGSGVS